MSSLRLATIVISGLLLASACSSLPGPDQVYRGDHAQVSLVSAGSAGARLAHPGNIDATSLRRILAALSYEEQGVMSRSAPAPVFEGEELDELAPRLAQTLAEARPDQRVAFVSLVPGASATSGARKTEGTVFMETGGRLNIAFSGIRHLLTVEDDFTRFREPSLGDPLRVTRSLITLSSEPASISARRQGNGEPYPMWVTADGGSTPARDATTEPQAPVQARTRTRTRTEPARESAESRPADTHSDETEPGSLQPEAVRERLAFLQSLYAEGLITTEEYEQERQRILRRLD